MGHIRLGAIPKSRAWSQVVSTLTKAAQASQSSELGGWNIPPSIALRTTLPEVTSSTSPSRRSLSEEGLAAIASETLAASERALNKAVEDEGLRYSFFLLTRISLASRLPDWHEVLGELGIELKDDSTAFDLTSEFQEAVDRHIYARGRPTDVSEMAQKAVGQVLCDRVGSRAETLFGNSGAELQNAVRAFSTKAGFAELGRSFFASFLSRFLNFYLSRITASELGSGSLGELGDITAFNRALDRHCYESAGILPDFLGEWYSKTGYLQGINLESASGAAAFALKKLQAELGKQRHGG